MMPCVQRVPPGAPAAPVALPLPALEVEPVPVDAEACSEPLVSLSFPDPLPWPLPEEPEDDPLPCDPLRCAAARRPSSSICCGNYESQGS